MNGYKTMMNDHKNVNPNDLDLMPVTDDVEEVVKYINDFYGGDSPRHELKPNYEL
ncbi:MAG: hypothetical protein R2784_15335 [Saprospiraceae bacterium]